MESSDIKNNRKDTREYIMDRVKKLTGALYRITDLLSDREPLKWTLRNKAMNIYDNLMSVMLSEREVRNKGNILDETLNNLSQLAEALELAFMGAYISDTNFNILKKEYSNLKDFIEGKREDIAPEQKLLVEFTPIADDVSGTLSIGHLKGQDEPKVIIEKTEEELKPIRQVEDAKMIITADIQNVPKTRILDIISIANRKDRIFELLKKEGPKSISEIAPYCGGVSEKSIQRDLSDFVKSGKVSAEGEKRWRRYKAVNN